MTSPEWAVHLPPATSVAAVDLLADRSLPGSWTRRWREDPGKRVLLDDARGWLTAARIEEETRTVAARYAGAGLQPGDRIVVSAAPSADLVIAHVAALRLGLTVVPVNSAYTEREVAHIVRDSGPAAAVVDDRSRARWIRDACVREPVITSPTVELPPGRAPSLDVVGPSDRALIGYTSGTTGAPKGAVLRHGNLLASAEALRLAWRWTPEDRLVLSLPMFHIHGLGVGLHGTLTSGAAVVIRPRFDPDDVFDSISTHRATLFFGVPTMYARLAAGGRLAELAALRLAVSGSAPLPPDLWHVVAARAQQRILERYGMTETVMNISNPYDGERRPGTVGFPLPGTEIRLTGDTSEIQLRGPNVFSGYWERADANAEAFTDDGWFRSGDSGARDPDGYVRIVGRLKELIITGGYNVYPREVEEVLRAHPGVNDVAVVGLPSAQWGEQVAAFVVPAGVLNPDDLLEYAAVRLAAYKRPRVLRLVDSLPHNALGKVLKHELRSQGV
ncbi:MAG: AMP-binding protein [Nitriliruptorales bacterium]|nr:AMP-binding protein [Nitriliruptorales bacterium]